MPTALAAACLSIPIGLTTLALNPTPTFADSPLTQSSVALSITSDNDDAYLAPTSSTTSEAHSYNMVTITMENTSSYSLYASASGTDANSQPTANLVNLNPTFSPAQNLTTIITPTASSQIMDVMSNNTWGYRIKQSATATIDPASTFLSTDPYSAITTTSTNITGNTTDRITDESSRYWLLDFGTKVDDTLAGGNYTNTITLSALASPITTETFTINYLLNDGSGTTYQTDTTELDPSGGDYTIPNTITNPIRSGYTFVGWDTTSSGTGQYQIGSTIPITTTPTDLYAIWQRNMATTFQTFTNDDCNAINFGETINLKDARDGKSYLVTKLKMSTTDTTGTCWMAQNLAISPGATLASSDSNIGASYTIPSTTAFSDNAGQDAIVPSHVDNTVDNYSANRGGFYTWGTATAGTFAATYDICPKGWRLPTGGDSGEFYKLYRAYGGSGTSGVNAELQKYFWGTAGTSATLSSVLVGSYGNGNSYEAGSFTYWWSSTSRSSTDIYNLYVSASNSKFFSQGYYYRSNGWSIRCLFAS